MISLFVCIWHFMLACHSSGIASLSNICTVNLWILLRNSAQDMFIFSVWIKSFPRAVRFLNLLLAVSTFYFWRCLWVSVGLEGAGWYISASRFSSSWECSVRCLIIIVFDSKFHLFFTSTKCYPGFKPSGLLLVFRFWHTKYFALIRMSKIF
jgi:hypothetical protein